MVMDAFRSYLDQPGAPWPPRSAPGDASSWVGPGVEVVARHVAGVRRHDVIPDAVPGDGVAVGIAVHRDRAAGRTEDGDGRSRGARRGTHLQGRHHCLVRVLDTGQPDVHEVLIDIYGNAAVGLRDVAAGLVQPLVIGPLAGAEH